MAKITIFEKMNDVTKMNKTRSDDGFIRLKGTFGVCGVRNNNKRIYETANYAKMIEAMKKRIVSEGCPGELEHPATMNIDYNNVSHVVEDINIDEKGVVTGTIKLLDTPKGKIAQALVEGGLPLFVSSRAQGTISEDGIVTLEDLKTYDLVGTPGFSQARVQVANEGRVCESVDDDMFYVVENEEKPIEENKTEIKKPKFLFNHLNNPDYLDPDYNDEIKENQNNEIDMTKEELNELHQRISYLESNLNEANNKIELLQKSNKKEASLLTIAEGVQKWIVDEYTPRLQKWIVEEYSSDVSKWITEEFQEGFKKNLVESLAPKLQKWIVEEFGGEINKWVTEEYTKHISEGLQEWLFNEYSPIVEKWCTSELAGQINENLQKNVSENKAEKLATIDEMLSLLEGNNNKTIKNRIVENAEGEPRYIANMPENIRPKWNMADESVKEYIRRKATIVPLNTEAQIQQFWESVDFEKAATTKSVYESVESTKDPFEQRLRMQLRRNRQ